MNLETVFENTDFVHTSGTKEELQVAVYLKKQCENIGAQVKMENFRVPLSTIKKAHLFADGVEIPCKAFKGCGSGTVEGELYYMPGTDPVSITGAADKIVLLDTSNISFFTYQDLREAVVGKERKVLCAMINVNEAVKLVKNETKRVRLEVEQSEYEGESHNVIAELSGKRKEWIVLSAHYDSTSLSHGAYDNMSGCVGLLGIMEKMRDKERNFGLRFLFCGSEECGLLGSKAYVQDHEKELEQMVLNINLDMIGSYMGQFIACVSAEEKLEHYIAYMAAEMGFPIAARSGVYSSDSTPFADKGIPAVSFARIAHTIIVPIHSRYDLKDVLSMKQLQKDINFLSNFTERLAKAAVCPVARQIPDNIKTELDEYLFRKRKK